MMKKKTATKPREATISRGHTRPDWYYAYPDERNTLILEARELISAVQTVLRKEAKGAGGEWTKAANRWMRATKP